MAAHPVGDSANVEPSDDVWLFDRLCDEFESCWQAGGSAAIDDFLARCPDSRSGELFGELLSLEVEYRVDRGEAPACDEYLQRFPGHAAAVHELFDRLESAETKSIAATRGGQRRTAGSLPGGEGMQAWGNYELLQMLGRGGMGVVYKARQLSLNRIVALKMIVSGQLASDDEVRRFYAEAEAAAHLDHPGIVRVYEVGRHEGCHFYSMAFVEGESLADRLAAGPLPPRDAAALLLQAAEAMAHAHEQGVIHRDLKPSNILLHRRPPTRISGPGPDTPSDASASAVRAMITDFGLAKRIESPSDLTVTGDVLGTPSFMSPEQAAGRTGDVGPPADIYSLGATLYAALTGRPPFQSADVAQTLRQVIEREPVSPRQLNGAVDRDLETICLKCLEKTASNRYATAADLADDLRRYLDRRPILARPITRVARLGRWCRRNPGVALLAGALLLTLVAGAVVSSVFAVRATANAQFYRKEKLRADGEARRAHAALGRERQALARQRAALEGTESSIYKYVQTLKHSAVLGDARFQPLRKQLLHEAMDHYQRYVERHRRDREAAARAKVAAALFEIAWMNSSSGLKEQALAAYQQSLAIREQLANESPADANRQADLALTHHNMAHVHREMGHLPASLAAFEKALTIRQRLAEDQPANDEFQQALALSYVGIGAVQAGLGNRADDIKALEKASEIQQGLVARRPGAPEFRNDLARTHYNLAVLHNDASQPAEALAELEKARALQDRLAKDSPSAVDYQNDLASTHQLIGRIQRDTGRPVEALKSFEAVLAIRKRIARENPTVAEYHNELAATHHILGNLHSIAGRPAQALAEWEQGLAIRERLARDYPAVVDHQTELATSYNSIGLSFRNAGKLAEALEAFRKAREIRDRLAAEHPKVADYRHALARSCNFVGTAFYDAGKLAEAETEWKRALALREELVRQFPAVLQLQKDLADSHHNLGAVYDQMKKQAEAQAEYEKALTGLQHVVAESPTVVEYQMELGSCHNDLGNVYVSLGKIDEAATEFRSALDILERLAQNEPEITDYQIRLASTWRNFAELAKESDPKTAAERLDKAVDALQKVLEREPGHPEARSSLRSTYVARGFLHDAEGQYLQAAADWEAWLRLNEGPPAKSVTLAMGLSLARAGEHRRAVAAVEPLTQELTADSLPLELARVYAICSERVLQDESLPQDERANQAQAYAATALGVLERAFESRSATAEERQELENSADFASLRSHDAFRRLFIQ